MKKSSVIFLSAFIFSSSITACTPQKNKNNSNTLIPNRPLTPSRSGGLTLVPPTDPIPPPPSNRSANQNIQIVFIGPNQGPATGNTLITVYAAGLDPINRASRVEDQIQITLNNAPCRITQISPDNTAINCMTPAFHSASSHSTDGRATLTLTQGHRQVIVPHAFTYTGTAGRPVNQPGRPLPAFGDYRNSEAQALFGHRITRLIPTHYLDFITLPNLERININNVPTQQVPAYVIHDAALAQRIGAVLGLSLRRESSITEEQYRTLTDVPPDLDENDPRNILSEDIYNALTNDSTIEYNETSLNPIFNGVAIPPEQQAYLDYLRNEVRRQIDELNRRAGGYYHSNASGLDYLSVNDNPQQRAQFTQLLELIRDSSNTQPQEEAFIRTLISLSTQFGQHRAESKMGFIEAFTHLFVTKKFSSRGVLHNYCHFILRCGQMF